MTREEWLRAHRERCKQIRGPKPRARSIYDVDPPPYTGPVYLGKPIGEKPAPLGPGWIGAAVL